MTFLGCDIRELIKASFNPSGRSSRREFIVHFLFWVSIIIVYIVIGALVSSFLYLVFRLQLPWPLDFLLYLVLVLAFVISMIIAQVRRLHDLGATGWLLLLEFVPIVNVIMLVILLFVKGKPEGETEWG